MENARLKRGLKTEVELVLCGGQQGAPEPSVLLLLRQGELPAALVTDARGVTTPKIIDYVDLLSALEGSCVVSELEKDPVRRLSLPALPEGALLLDAIERPSGNSYVVTGVTRPREHLFVTDGKDGSTTYDIPLPAIAYRALWHEPSQVLKDLSVALCSPESEEAPTAATELYRWPFAHVYDRDSGPGQPAYYGRVCWAGLGSVSCELSDVVPAGVEAFVAAPNDAVGHAAHISAYAPTRDYQGFLAATEQNGGLQHDWLEPCAMTIEDLHHQKRREA